MSVGIYVEIEPSWMLSSGISVIKMTKAMSSDICANWCMSLKKDDGIDIDRASVMAGVLITDAFV